MKSKSKKIVFLVMQLITVNLFSQPMDGDGNSYGTIGIGTQLWLIENLRTTSYNDGSSIPNVTDNSTWANLTSPAYCWYNNDNSNAMPYGAMYNWYVVSIAHNGGKNVCPIGYHIPTEAEYTTLANFLGGSSVAGKELKETGTAHWNSPNTGTNSSGFTGIGSGYRDYTNGTFSLLKTFGFYWTNESSFQRYVFLRNNFDNFFFSGANITDGISIRCLSDTPLPVELIEFKGAKNKDQIKLNWTTASELSNSGFEIQKSKNGRNWQILDFIQGNGTSSLLNEYEYHDSNPFLGINYYRLKQIDYDGVFEYSKVIAVEYNNPEKEIQVFPNPSNRLINIQIDNSSNQRMKVKIFDNLGRNIWASELIEGEHNWRKELEIEGNGIYFIIAQIGNEVFYERVVILNEK